MITIVNKHQGSNGVYVGRPTVLGNPYTLKVYKLGQHILAISGEIRRPGLEGGKSGV